MDHLGAVNWDLRQPARAAAYWRESAAVMQDVSEHEAATRLGQLAADAARQGRR